MSRRPYVREVSKTRWYFSHARYLRYMSREVTCIFIGAFALLLVCALGRLSEGPVAWDAFVAALEGPWSAFGLLLVLAFAAYNSFTWFNVTPKAMPVQIGEEFLPGRYIVIAHYVLWIVVTLVVLYFAGVL